jgi:D-alanine-D-alanine ligase
VTSSAAGPRLRVGVVFGGQSSEHAISCISAGSVLAAIDRDRFDPVPIGIGADGRWVLPPAGLALAIDGDRLPAVPSDVAEQQPVALLRGLDVVFPLLHGPFGEDGTLQGLLELSGVPYVGSGVFASAAAMDKHQMKLLLRAAGLPVPDHVLVRPDRPLPVEVRALGLPVFVKPARGGSSIGISRVDEPAELDAAVAHAREHDPKVLVEAAVVGREVECGVLDGPDGPQASLPAEIELVDAGHSFYDFQAKYFPGATRFSVPPDLPVGTIEEVRRLAVAAFDALGCEGLARVDFFVTPDGDVLVNEVNTMPGFTPQSMYPRMWAATGVDYADLVARLIDDAVRRGTGLR